MHCRLETNGPRQSRPHLLDYATPAASEAGRAVPWWVWVPAIVLMTGVIFYRGGALDSQERGTIARRAAANTDLANLASALDAFETDTGRYPTTEEELGALIAAPPGTPGWRGPYLRRPLVTDPWGNAYSYQATDESGAINSQVSSNGPDGTPGTADDVRLTVGAALAAGLSSTDGSAVHQKRAEDGG